MPTRQHAACCQYVFTAAVPAISFAGLAVRCKWPSLQGYCNKFKPLLAQLTQQEDDKARQQLNCWALEFQTLMLATALLHPGKMNQFAQIDMNDGIDGSKTQKPDDHHILVSFMTLLSGFN